MARPRRWVRATGLAIYGERLAADVHLAVGDEPGQRLVQRLERADRGA